MGRTDEGAKHPVTRRACLLAARCTRCARCGVSWHRIVYIIKETANTGLHRLMRKKHCSVGFSRSQSLLTSGSHGDAITLTACRASVPTRSRPVKRFCWEKLSSSSWLAIVVAITVTFTSHKSLRQSEKFCSPMLFGQSTAKEPPKFPEFVVGFGFFWAWKLGSVRTPHWAGLTLNNYLKYATVPIVPLPSSKFQPWLAGRDGLKDILTRSLIIQQNYINVPYC